MHHVTGGGHAAQGAVLNVAMKPGRLMRFDHTVFVTCDDGDWHGKLLVRFLKGMRGWKS